MGGLVFGAGGGGLERGLEAARAVFQVGTPVLVGLDELEGDDQVMIMTGVGAPGTQRSSSGRATACARSSSRARPGRGTARSSAR